MESVKVNLIDNSMLKSKIQAASKRNNLRNRSSVTTLTPSTNINKLSTSSSKMEIIDEKTSRLFF